MRLVPRDTAQLSGPANTAQYEISDFTSRSSGARTRGGSKLGPAGHCAARSGNYTSRLRATRSARHLRARGIPHITPGRAPGRLRPLNSSAWARRPWDTVQEHRCQSKPIHSRYGKFFGILDNSEAIASSCGVPGCARGTRCSWQGDGRVVRHSACLAPTSDMRSSSAHDARLHSVPRDRPIRIPGKAAGHRAKHVRIRQ